MIFEKDGSRQIPLLVNQNMQQTNKQTNIQTNR